MGHDLPDSLVKILRRTFEHRDTDIPTGEPAAFSAQFAREKQGQWGAFLKTSAIMDAPDQLELILNCLQEFILLIFESTHAGRKFGKKWKAGGPWR